MLSISRQYHNHMSSIKAILQSFKCRKNMEIWTSPLLYQNSLHLGIVNFFFFWCWSPAPFGPFTLFGTFFWATPLKACFDLNEFGLPICLKRGRGRKLWLKFDQTTVLSIPIWLKRGNRNWGKRLSLLKLKNKCIERSFIFPYNPNSNNKESYKN